MTFLRQCLHSIRSHRSHLVMTSNRIRQVILQLILFASTLNLFAEQAVTAGLRIMWRTNRSNCNAGSVPTCPVAATSPFAAANRQRLRGAFACRAFFGFRKPSWLARLRGNRRSSRISCRRCWTISRSRCRPTDSTTGEPFDQSWRAAELANQPTSSLVAMRRLGFALAIGSCSSPSNLSGCYLN